jgi:intracellular sulfur oxidation DsrE/DsrF family protein
VAKSFYQFLLLLSFLFIVSIQAFANDGKSIDDILELKKEPAGVVIEIVTWGGDNLEWALPQAQKYITQLREIFPKLPVAIVTHGAEQFALTKDSKNENKKVHSLVQSLGEADVPVHVCETFAGWRGLSAEDFPSYVNVAAAGPAQVNDYVAIGYELIVITEEDD